MGCKIKSNNIFDQSSRVFHEAEGSAKAVEKRATFLPRVAFFPPVKKSSTKAE
jgi:hypothetical protein